MVRVRRGARPAAAGLVARRALGADRAPELDAGRRCAVHRRQARGHRQPTPRSGARRRSSSNYDENDGYFDHVPPPKAPAGTPGEFVDGLPIGPGFRVPTIVVSPWSVGGCSCSRGLRPLVAASGSWSAGSASASRTSAPGGVGDRRGPHLGVPFAAGRKHYPADPNLGYRWATLGLAKAQQQVQNNPPPQPPATRADPACL